MKALLTLTFVAGWVSIQAAAGPTPPQTDGGSGRASSGSTVAAGDPTTDALGSDLREIISRPRWTGDR